MAQKLDPELKKIYDRVMSTPTKKGASQTHKAPPPKTESKPSAAAPKQTHESPPSAPVSKQKAAFLSSMPMRPMKNMGVKAFTFTGKKKIVQKEEAPKAAEPKAEHKEKVQTTEKKKPSGMLIGLILLGFVIMWGLFWAYLFDFLSF